MRTGKGALAEYIVVKPNVVVPKPSNISHAEAASFPLAGLTAFLALVTNGRLKKGDEKRVFVNGGSGGVGAWAIQVSRRSDLSVSTQTYQSDTDCQSIWCIRSRYLFS